MILVHKPTPFPMTFPASYHRRLSSAPVVAVQPTRTPGLLSIIPKGPPPKPFQQRTRAQLKGRIVSEKQRSEDLSKAPVKLPVESVKPQEKHTDKVPAKITSAPTPDKSPRGRQNNKPKDKPVKRSVSLSSARVQSRRQPRQPSPLRTTSQTDATSAHPTTINSNRNRLGNAFDPFLASSSDTDFSDSNKLSTRKFKDVSPRVTPQLTKPSGKLAHRRQQALNSPTPSKSIPVPRPKGRTVASVGLSRSAPVSKTTTRPVSDSGIFPICDDMTDIDGDHSRPSTPVRKPAAWQQSSVIDDGPRTAPLSTSLRSFPFNLETPSPSLIKARQRRHARAPSEGVFNLSFDEDYVSSSETSEELKALFNGMLGKKRRMNRPSAEDLTNRTDAERAAYFASSTFQNSPSPEDLPAPAFVH